MGGRLSQRYGRDQMHHLQRSSSRLDPLAISNVHIHRPVNRHRHASRILCRAGLCRRQCGEECRGRQESRQRAATAVLHRHHSNRPFRTVSLLGESELDHHDPPIQGSILGRRSAHQKHNAIRARAAEAPRGEQGTRFRCPFPRLTSCMQEIPIFQQVSILYEPSAAQAFFLNLPLFREVLCSMRESVDGIKSPRSWFILLGDPLSMV